MMYSLKVLAAANFLVEKEFDPELGKNLILPSEVSEVIKKYRKGGFRMMCFVVNSDTIEPGLFLAEIGRKVDSLKTSFSTSKKGTYSEIDYLLLVKELFPSIWERTRTTLKENSEAKNKAELARYQFLLN